MIRNVRDLRKTSRLLSRKDEGPGKKTFLLIADYLEDPEVAEYHK
jgi:hypothetical protein